MTYAELPEHIKRRKNARKAKWFRMNPDKRREYNRRYYAKNAEARRENAKAWRLANPGWSAASAVKFRERNPNYQQEWKARTKLKRAWLSWSRVCALSREVRKESEVEA